MVSQPGQNPQILPGILFGAGRGGRAPLLWGFSSCHENTRGHQGWGSGLLPCSGNSSLTLPSFGGEPGQENSRPLTPFRSFGESRIPFGCSCFRFCQLTPWLESGRFPGRSEGGETQGQKAREAEPLSCPSGAGEQQDRAAASPGALPSLTHSAETEKSWLFSPKYTARRGIKE